MCELNAFIDGIKLFEDVVYAEDDGEKVLLKNILGEVRKEPNCRITKIDISSAILVLSRSRDD